MGRKSAISKIFHHGSVFYKSLRTTNLNYWFNYKNLNLKFVLPIWLIVLISSANIARMYFVYLHVVCVQNSFAKIHSHFFITSNERRSSFRKCEFGASDVAEHESGRLDQWILTFFVSKSRKKATPVCA